MMKRILIADDDGTNRYMLETLLKGYGFEVISAQNGEDALEKAYLSPPDLIVTDILMPVMDGYALCRRWKSDDTLKHIPLLFYTATYTGSKDEDFALSLGAERFIIKPQEPEALMNILKEVLEEHFVVKQVATKSLGEEMEFFRQYNEILFKKLEKKMSDLEIAYQEMKLLEERYRLSFENVSDVIYMNDADLNIISISPSLESVLGYNPQDFIGRPATALRNILTPESFEQAVVDTGLIFEGKTIPATVYRFIAKDGTFKYGEVSWSPLIRDGKITGVISVARDITDRKRAEEELRTAFVKSQELEFIVNHSPAVAWLWKAVPGWPVEYVSDNLTFYGYTPDDFTSGRIKYVSIVYPEDLPRVGAEVEQYTHEGRTEFSQEYRIVTKSGDIRWIDDRTWVRRGPDGSATHYQGIAIDVTVRKNIEQQLHQTLDNLRKAFGTTIQVMVSAIEIRDPYTAGHQLQVADLARAIATEMGFSREKIEGVRLAGSIHDIGKLSVPAEILSKPTTLSETEFTLVKEHAQNGYEILKDVESPWPLAEIVYQHHERMDGSGYPRKLKGDDILIEARIMAVADVVEAMSSHRPYRPGKGTDKALEEIEKNRGILYDDAVADACLRLFREKGFRLKGTGF